VVEHMRIERSMRVAGISRPMFEEPRPHDKPLASRSFGITAFSATYEVLSQAEDRRTGSIGPALRGSAARAGCPCRYPWRPP
jgi:hypothetical protein